MNDSIIYIYIWRKIILEKYKDVKNEKLRDVKKLYRNNAMVKSWRGFAFARSTS